MLINLFEKLLSRAVNLAELNKILTKYLADFGITTFSFTYYSYHSRAKSKIKYDFASPSLKLWHDHYLAENYDEVDSHLDEEYREVLPKNWDIHKQIESAKGRREKQMRLDGLKFGAEKGLSIPIHGAHDDFANLMVEQLQGQKCLEKRDEIKFELLAAGYCYYHYMKKLLLKQITSEDGLHLSQREMQIMQLVAQEYSVSEIAKELAITERTVNFHIQRVNKKLGTNNKYQSVSTLLEQKILNI